VAVLLDGHFGWASHSAPCTKHVDVTMMKEALVDYHHTIDRNRDVTMADLGYVSKELPRFITGHKKPKGGTLTSSQLRENKLLNEIRGRDSIVYLSLYLFAQNSHPILLLLCDSALVERRFGAVKNKFDSVGKTWRRPISRFNKVLKFCLALMNLSDHPEHFTLEHEMDPSLFEYLLLPSFLLPFISVLFFDRLLFMKMMISEMISWD
jgi:hypothetical protein